MIARGVDRGEAGQHDLTVGLQGNAGGSVHARAADVESDRRRSAEAEPAEAEAGVRGTVATETDNGEIGGAAEKLDIAGDHDFAVRLDDDPVGAVGGPKGDVDGALAIAVEAGVQRTVAVQ